MFNQWGRTPRTKPPGLKTLNIISSPGSSRGPLLTLTTRGIGFYWAKLFLFFQNSYISQVISGVTKTNTRHVDTHFNAFLMVIQNMVMKFNNFDIFYKIWYIFDLLSALACCAVSVNLQVCHSVCILTHQKLTILDQIYNLCIRGKASCSDHACWNVDIRLIPPSVRAYYLGIETA